MLAQENCKKAIAVLRYIIRLNPRGLHGKKARAKVKALKGKCR